MASPSFQLPFLSGRNRLFRRIFRYRLTRQEQDDSAQEMILDSPQSL